MPHPLAEIVVLQNQQPDSAFQSTCAPLDAPTPLRLWHLCSLDAPTVAVVWSLSFARAAGVHLPRWIPLLLALGTWSVYIFDRLLDSRKALRSSDLSSLRERHFFHWRHRRVLLPCAFVAAMVAIGIVYMFMPAGARGRNSVLALATLAYFSGVHLPFTPRRRPVSAMSKELLVGVLFTAGCVLPTLSRLAGIGIHAVSLLSIFACFAFFAALAWLNCSAIESWESKPGFRVGSAAVFLGLVGLFTGFSLASVAPRGSALLVACAVSAFLLAALDRVQGRVTPVALRSAADLVLLTPLVLLIR